MRLLPFRLFVITFGAALVCPVLAAPRVGPPFFVADPRTTGEAFPGVSASEGGFVVAWVAEREVAFRRLAVDGTLGSPGGILFTPYETTGPGSHALTYATAPLEVAGLGSEALIAFQRATDADTRPAGPFVRFEPQAIVVGGNGEPAVPVSLSMTSFMPLPFAITSREAEWASLQWRTGFNTGPLEVTFARAGENGEPVVTSLFSHPFQPPSAPSIAPGGVALASDGTAYLAVWSVDGSLRLARISTTGEVSEIPSPPGWISSGPVRVASNGSGYVVAWTSADGELRVAPIDGAGAIGNASSVPVAMGASRVLDLDPAGVDYLVTYESTAEGGIAVRAARVAADGTVRDSTGFELGPTAEIAVTGVNDALWLMVQASHVEPGRTLLEGRFIGEVVPSSPDNPVPPPSPRPRPLDDAGAIPSDGGATGNGGSATGGASSGSGGTSAGGATASGGSPRAGGKAGLDAGAREPPAIDSRGCDCEVAGSENSAGALAACALLGLSLAWRRRRE